MTYQQIKDWFKEKDNKNKIVVLLSLVLMFIVGFGAGRYERELRRDRLQTNYTTNKAPKETVTKTPMAEAGAVKGTTTDVQKQTGCIIKGNISTAGKKVYHVPGGSYYKIVKPEQCFNTEAEAKTSGFVKSAR